MDLTYDQENALCSMKEWNELPKGDPDDLFYLLDGPAGSGKTTVMKYFINRIGTSGVGVSAPTHKAKKVIQQATGFTAHTIQKLLGLRPNVQMDKFDINRPQFDPIGEETINQFRIIIIDEASMLNADAHKLIVKRATVYGTKILFLGDEYQLPPINERIGAVFTKTTHRSRLTEIVRQANTNPNAKLLEIARRDIELNRDLLLQKLLEKGTNLIGDEGYHILNNKDFGNKLLEKFFNSQYEYNRDFIKYLAWTNKSVESWCVGLRKQIYGEAANEPFIVGEGLVGYNTIPVYRSNNLIENSEDYIITNVEVTTKSNVKGYKIEIKDSNNITRTVFMVHPDFITEYVVEADRLLEIAQRYKGRNWKKFYEYVQRHLLLYDIKKTDKQVRAIELKAYYKYDLMFKKDLYYAYGSTVHKS